MLDIGIPPYGPDETIRLSPDQKGVLMNLIKEEVQGLSMLHSLVDKSEVLNRELFRNVFSLNEARLVDMCKMTCVELETVAERDNRFARIRAVNLRNHELEKLLGMTGTPKHTATHLKELAKNLKNWWQCDGFGHVREMSFTEHGLVKAQLSCTLFGDFPVSNSATPVSDAAAKPVWLAALAARGFVLKEQPHERMPVLVDCDNSRKALIETIFRAMPSAKIWKTENHCQRDGTITLESVHIDVFDLADLQSLAPISGFTVNE